MLYSIYFDVAHGANTGFTLNANPRAAAVFHGWPGATEPVSRTDPSLPCRPAYRRCPPRADRLRHDVAMVVDLALDQWGGVDSAQVRAHGGTVYVRGTTRMKRRAAEDHIADGVPIVVYWFGGGRLDWCDGTDAISQWQHLRGNVTSQEPSPRNRQEPQWTVGLWESPDGLPLLVLTGHC